MSDRITRVTTRGGDTGLTRLADGSQVNKTHPRVEAIGAVDELNSALGLLIATVENEQLLQHITKIQNELFDAGAYIASPDGQTGIRFDVTGLEEATRDLNDTLPPLKEFVIPGPPLNAALAHVARTTARRAERRIWAFIEEEAELDTGVAVYFNRLSDFLFVLARVLKKQASEHEPQWRGL